MTLTFLSFSVSYFDLKGRMTHLQNMHGGGGGGAVLKRDLVTVT